MFQCGSITMHRWEANSGAQGRDTECLESAEPSAWDVPYSQAETPRWDLSPRCPEDDLENSSWLGASSAH